MVWQVLAMPERGEWWEYIRQAWPGRVSDDAIEETIRLESGADSEPKPAQGDMFQ
jgi:hypothetical protein